MKWLLDNPLGMALAGISGIFVLLSAALAIIWALPVAVETGDAVTPGNTDSDVVMVAHQADSLDNLQVINEKPVFNISRLPVIDQSDDEELVDDPEIAIKDAPDVRLTGVIITPNVKIASLTPADDKLEGVTAHEGESLTGDYVGWKVSSIKPRNVILESRDGEKLDLDLQVHDVTIKEPPKPPPTEKVAEESAGEDGEPLSRAEQIRQRIAERREELRREQEDQQARGGQPQSSQRQGGQPPSRSRQNQTQAGDDKQEAEPQDYQSAIRALMNKNIKDMDDNDNKDG